MDEALGTDDDKGMLAENMEKLSEIIKHFYKEEHKIHWRQRIVALEFVLITVVGSHKCGKELFG